jgi:activator of HSP90 ATPase
LRKDGRTLLQGLIASFFQDLRNRIQNKQAPATNGSEPEKPASAAPEKPVPTAQRAPQAVSMSGRTTVEITQHFECAPEALYDALTNSQRITGFTAAPATFDARVGGKFEMFAGAVCGEIKELVRDFFFFTMHSKINHFCGSTPAERTQTSKRANK